MRYKRKLPNEESPLECIYDYWKNASRTDWRYHVIQSLDMSRDLIADWDHTTSE